MTLIIKIIVTAIFVGVAQYITQVTEKWSDIWIKIVIPVITAALLVIASYLIDEGGKLLSKPSFTIKTSTTGNEIDFNIKVKKGSLEQISFDYPIIGVITNFNDLNSITDAKTVVAGAIGGAATSSVQNNLQLSITNIRTGSSLEYKVFYNPSSENVQIGGTDRYKLVYVWEYGGEKVQETEWRFIKNDQITREPDMVVNGLQIFHKTLTEQEINDLFKQGPPKQNFLTK